MRVMRDTGATLAFLAEMFLRYFRRSRRNHRQNIQVDKLGDY